MGQSDLYMKKKHDLSGSRSKNRFRLELLWGISKMLELMKTTDDFTVVFDYVCDIEVHKSGKFEFYQVKTHTESQPHYTSKSLVRYKKGQEGSILGKLFALMQDDDKAEVILVCNTPFRSLSNVPGLASLELLSKEDKSTISNALKVELGVKTVDFSKSYYLYTPMNLCNPEDEIKGTLVSSFEEIKGSEPRNPNALYRLIYGEVCDRASYEYEMTDYDELIEKKGISRTQFDKMLDAHCANEKTGVNATISYIESLSGIHCKMTYRTALSSVISKLTKSKVAQEIEKKVALFISENPEINEIDDMLDKLSDTFHSQFPIEYSNAEKTVFYILVIKKYEEGGYYATGI